MLASPSTRRTKLSWAAPLSTGLVLAFLVQTGSVQAQAGVPNYIGKSLPRLTIDKWHNGGPLHPFELRGNPWVLVMMSVDSPLFERVVPLLESIHKGPKEGGPVVVLMTKEENDEVKKVLRKRGTKPSFAIATDRRLETYRELDPSPLPYLYVVGADSKVTAQGPLDQAMQEHLRRLSDGRSSGGKPTPPGDEPAQPNPPGKSPPERKSPPKKPTVQVGPAQLTEEFEKKLSKALRRGSPKPLIALLREVYEGSEQPSHPRLRRLWQKLQSALDEEKERVRSLGEKGRFSRARQLLPKIEKQFLGFPPAVSGVRGLLEQLAKAQADEWLSDARKAKRAGDYDGARSLLDKILEHYAATSVGEAARELRAELDAKRP